MVAWSPGEAGGASRTRMPPRPGPEHESWKSDPNMKDLVIWRRAAPASLWKLPKVLRVIRGRARARKLSDIQTAIIPVVPTNIPQHSGVDRDASGAPRCSRKNAHFFKYLVSRRV